MTPFLPDFQNLVALLNTWMIGGLLLLAGAGLTGRGVAPELQIASGWGALCLALTGWGVYVPLSLHIPAAAFAVAAIAIGLLPRRRPSGAAWAALGRTLVISLPLWLIMAPVRPSQPDAFLNLLPNAFYLVDYGRLPTSLLPPSFSLLPAAPYNTQFLSFLGSALQPDYPASGMSLINIMLQLVAALAIARALGPTPMSPATAPNWGLVAVGFLSTTLLNPGFVPRIHFSAYGESALAAMAVLAAWLFVLAQGELAVGARPTQLLPLALILAAIVNIKQTGFGLVAALAAAALISICAEHRVQPAAAAKFALSALLPAVLLFAMWRYHVAHAGVDELQPLPFAEWHWDSLRETAASAFQVVAGKPLYFACVAAAILMLPLLLARQGWTPTTRLLTLNAALFVSYNIFLAFVYVAVFPLEMSIEAHSYFRYNTHLTLVLVLSLAVAARDLGAGVWLRRNGLRLAGTAAVLTAIFAPVGFAKRLRFDLDMPQPLVWDLAKKASAHIWDGDRLALLLPGDNSSVATMIAGVLADTSPRRTMLDLLPRNTADPATLQEAARLGYRLALISCTPEGWEELPAGQAVLLRYQAEGWHLIAAWPYPANAAALRWQHILSWGPLCRGS